MSGPAVGLWLFVPADFDHIVARTAPWLETFCELVGDRPAGELSFHVRDATALGCQPLDATNGGRFSLSEDDCLPADDEDYSSFSTPPVLGLILSAGSSGPVNHKLLGYLALGLARRLDALIDFDGVLGYPSPRDETRNSDDLARARALVASLPGRIKEVSYDTGGGGRWIRHVGDTEFLAAWLQHPAFHMIK